MSLLPPPPLAEPRERPRKGTVRTIASRWSDAVLIEGASPALGRLLPGRQRPSRGPLLAARAHRRLVPNRPVPGRSQRSGRNLALQYLGEVHFTDPFLPTRHQIEM